MPLISVDGASSHVMLASGEQLTILDGIDFQVRAGQKVAILGRSGSGKTTLMTLLGMMNKPDSGTVEIAGQQSGQLSDTGLSRFRSANIGFVFQNYSLIPHLDVFHNVEMPLVYAKKFHRREYKARVRAALDAVGMMDRISEMPAKLSGGEQQRVAIARAIVTEPKVLLADEPTGALDTVTAEKILDLLCTIGGKEDSCLVVVTHDPEVARDLDVSYELTPGGLRPLAAAAEVAL